MTPIDPAWLDRSEYPFTSRWFETPFGNMHYLDEGSGEPIVFVHGVPTWSFSYRRLIRAFRGRYRCVAPDHLGFGLSAKPEGWSYRPDELAALLETLIGALDLRNITLVVHDFGGPIGLSYPIRVPQNVQRVVIFNSWLWSSRDDVRARLLGEILASGAYAALVDRFNLTTRFVLPAVITNRAAFTPAIWRHYQEPLARPEDRAGARGVLRALRESDAWYESLWEQRARLADLPALIVWGLDDRVFTPNDLRRWRRIFPRSRLRAYRGVGHLPMEEAAEDVVAQIAGFLATPDR